MKITLKAARANANLSQAEAAEKLGISRLTLIKYEKQPTSAPTGILVRMSGLYGMTLDEFILDDSSVPKD